MFASFENIPESIEKVRPFESREIKYAFHDIDGTHSLIRNWVPVMTLCTGFASQYTWKDGISPQELAAIMAAHSPDEYPEGLKFSIESAGLSALTQMEWGIRRSIQNGKNKFPGTSDAVNSEIIRRIWNGIELFDDLDESPEFRNRIAQMATELFFAYEILLLQMGRDNNLADARVSPEKWRVPGSMQFLHYLQENGVKNYFVTGAVVEYDENGIPHGTMVDEVLALKYEIGPGKLIENLVGSTWNEKLPKDKIMLKICEQMHFNPKEVLVVGDGRSEIAAGVKMGAICLSRLNADSCRAREIHKQLGTNIIVTDYDMKLISQFLF